MTTPSGETIGLKTPALYQWEQGTLTALFNFRGGRVTVKNPDGAVLAKMLEVAEKLGAKVIGDEGEQY